MLLSFAACLDNQISSGREFHIFAFTGKHRGCTDGSTNTSADRRAFTATQQSADPCSDSRCRTDFNGVAFL
jgi:hypothetical protein